MTSNIETTSCSDLRLRVSQLELMLVESNHRIANSLQLAASLAANGARAVSDPAAQMRILATQSHIDAIADVHRMLIGVQSGALIPLHGYLSRLIAGLQASVGAEPRGAALSLDCDPLHVAPEVAVSFGMIVNELVSNACKHAFDPEAPGQIRIRLAVLGSGFLLEIEDDGLGMGRAARPSDRGSGTRIVEILARQIDASFHYERGSFGTKAVILGTGRVLGRLGGVTTAAETTIA